MSTEQRASGSGVIVLTLIVAAVLTVMPWPDSLSWMHPQWLTLAMIYWVLALPERVGVFWGFAVGLFQDVLLNSTMGQHALALSLTCFFTLLAYKRLRRLGMLAQSVMMFFLVGIALWVGYIIQDAMGQAWLPPYVMLLSALASAIVWIPVYAVLRWTRQRFLVR